MFSEVGRRLLDNGFSPKSNHGGFDLNQNEALRWAATFGFVNLVEALVRLGADLESKDENGHSAFHLAAKDEPDGAGKVLNFLAKVKPGLVEDKDKDGLTALHLAALNGHLEALKALVLSDANVFAVTKNGWTALHQAARTGRCSIIQLLLVECGAEIGCRDESGWSPLHLACINGYLEAAKQLIELGSDIDWRSFENAGVLHAWNDDDFSREGNLLLEYVRLGMGVLELPILGTRYSQPWGCR